MIKAEITPPLEPSKILRSANDIVPSLNVVSIVDSSVSIETQAAASPIAFDAEYTGLLYLRYLTTFIIAIVIVPNVYNRLKISKQRICNTDAKTPHFCESGNEGFLLVEALPQSPQNTGSCSGNAGNFQRLRDFANR